MNDEDRLDELLSEWEKRFQDGEDVPAEKLCPDRPDLVPVLAARIKDLRGMRWLDEVPPDPGEPPTPDHPPAGRLIGSFVGRFQLLEKIGEGGFAEVYRGHDPNLGREVAIKIPRPGGHARGAGDVLKVEANCVAGLNGPGIVRIYDVGQHDGVTFIVSELIEGIDLARKLRDGPVPVREAVRIVAEAAGHLHHAHRLGFVHRDIKPANLLLDRAGRVFVTDFGIAVTQDEFALRGEDGLGTWPYMAPERTYLNSDRIDARTDVYSLGVVMYELLTGNRPFRADSRDGWLREIRHTPPPSLRSWNPGVPGELDRICIRCLMKSPTDRYPNAPALASDLSRWLTHRTGLPEGRPGPRRGSARRCHVQRVRTPRGPRPHPAPPELDPGYAVFDGLGRNGWAFFGPLPEPPGAVRIEDGALVLRTVEDRHYRLCTGGTYRDFDLRFEYCYPANRAARDAGCSVLLRIADPAQPAGAHTQVKFGDWTAGYIVHPGLRLGNASEIDPLPAAVGVERPFGEWNEMALTCAGGVAEVWINARRINWEDGLPEHEGRIGFSCPACDEVRVRNIRIRHRVP